MAEYRLRIDTTRDRAVEFVTRLGEDDDFRAQLQKDPRRVLFDYGVELSDELIPETIELPAKEDVQRVLTDDTKAYGVLQPGPASFFPVFVCFYSFPYLHAE
jgi:hypothetical protein